LQRETLAGGSEGDARRKKIEKHAKERFQCADLLLGQGIDIWKEEQDVWGTLTYEPKKQEDALHAFVKKIQNRVDGNNSDKNDLKSCVKQHGVLMYGGAPGHATYLQVLFFELQRCSFFFFSLINIINIVLEHSNEEIQKKFKTENRMKKYKKFLL
jgi:hypothetical protein